MYWRFTDRARKVMQLANQEAQRLNHEYIGTEHILLGLVKEGSGLAAQIFKDLSIDLQKVRLEVEKLVQFGPATVTLGKLPQTPRARKAIEYAIEESRSLGHNYVGTEHLLLGVLREGQGVGATVLLSLGLNLDGLRAVILDYLANGSCLRPHGHSRRGLVGWLWGCCASGDPEPGPSPFREQENRLRALEGQLQNTRVVLSLLVGVLVGAVLGGEPGAFAGLLVGTLVGIVGGRGLGALVGAAPGAALVSTYLPGEGWVVIGLGAGALLGAYLGGIGPPLRLRRPVQPTLPEADAARCASFPLEARRFGDGPVDTSRWPAEARRTLEELDARLDKLTQEKEGAVSAQDFEKAANLRDQAEQLWKQRQQLIRDMQGT
jgi:hypothetical protein